MNFRSAPEFHLETAGDRTTTSARRSEIALLLERCPNRSPRIEPPAKQSVLKEHTVAWDLIDAQSAPVIRLPRFPLAEAAGPRVH
jgi:hypothetical protein